MQKKKRKRGKNKEIRRLERKGELKKGKKREGEKNNSSSRMMAVKDTGIYR